LIGNSRILSRLFGLSPKKVPFIKKPKYKYGLRNEYMDYARGIKELASAISERRPCRLSARFSLHVNEIVLAIQSAFRNGASYQLSSSFDPVDPMPWAKSK
jgi:hypothetical protein